MSTNERIPDADFDRLAAAWLADGPTELADRVLDDALREVHLTHHRRRLATPWTGPFGPRRFPQMSMLARAVIGLAAVLVVAVGGYSLLGSHAGIGGLQTTPAPTPVVTPRVQASPIPEPPFDASFTSRVYGYTIHYPGAWTVTPAKHRWTKVINSGGDQPYWGDLALDTLQGPGIRLIAWAQPIPQGQGLSPGQSADLWARNLGIGSGPCDGASPLPKTFGVGMGQAYTIINGCPTSGSFLNAGAIYEVAVAANQTGWVFTFDGRVDAAYVQNVLDQVVIDGALPSLAPS